MKQKTFSDAPSAAQLEAELNRVKSRRRRHSALRNTTCAVVAIVAAAVLTATLWMPVLRSYGGSMTPTLQDGEILLAIRTSDLAPGDIVAFYCNNTLLVKRIICGPGDWVDMDEAGNVCVNQVALDEPYLTEKALGDCNIQLPYQVPDGKYFVMGDHRATSLDSRNTAVGCVAQEQLLGRVLFRVWPLSRFDSVA